MTVRRAFEIAENAAWISFGLVVMAANGVLKFKRKVSWRRS